MKNIKVTDLESGAVSFYKYSRANWAGRPACMVNDSVIMWAPKGLERPKCKAVITSGRRWELVDDCDE